jgi:hypothetical protein
MKAEPSILDREAGRTIDLRAGQFENARQLIFHSFDPGSNVSAARFVILRRVSEKITSSDDGSESDFKLSHPQNALSSIVRSSEGDSKTIEDRAKQPQRHPAPIERTFLGIQIDVSEEQSENDRPGTSTSRDPDSNATDESDLQSEKHPHPKISTDEGIQIDLREKHSKNARSPIRLSCDTDANAIAKSKLHFMKQLSPIDMIDGETENDVRERPIISLFSITGTTLPTVEIGAGERFIRFADWAPSWTYRLTDSSQKIGLDRKTCTAIVRKEALSIFQVFRAEYLDFRGAISEPSGFSAVQFLKGLVTKAHRQQCRVWISLQLFYNFWAELEPIMI